MNRQKRALLLIGSPRGLKSTSQLIGNYLLDKLQQEGVEAEKVWIYPLMKSNQGKENLLSSVNRSDIVVFIFPLHWDSQPSLVIEMMELIALHRKSIENPKKHQLIAISNSGFPEAHHNDTVLAICRRFAKETGMEWVGGIGISGGEALGLMSEALGNKPLQKLGFMSRNDRKSLDFIVEALTTEETVPQKIIDKRIKRPVPNWMYILLGTISVRREAKKNKLLERIYDRPYQ
jgi:multimeric flavodoxin WrbA